MLKDVTGKLLLISDPFIEIEKISFESFADGTKKLPD